MKPPAAFTCAGCDRCGDFRPPEVFENAGLYVQVMRGYWLCLRCWKAARCPAPRLDLTAQEVHAVEERAREAMVRRGGADRYLVRKGAA